MIIYLRIIYAAIFAPLSVVRHWFPTIATSIVDVLRSEKVVAQLPSKKEPRDEHEIDKAKSPPEGTRSCLSPSNFLSSKIPPHCNKSLPKDERIKFLLDHLEISDKISLLGNDSPSIYYPPKNHQPEIYLPSYSWWNEGLHGVATTSCCPPHKWTNVTVFPQVLGMSMSWNRSLWAEVGDVIANEATEKWGSINFGIESGASSSRKMEGIDAVHPGLTYWTPNINIFRDPRWGRGQETPGEDPFLTSHYAATMVLALQYGKDFLNMLKEGGCTDDTSGNIWGPRIAATCKHFAAYSLENNRFNFSAEIHDERDWEDTYFPAFQACVHSEKFLRDYYSNIGLVDKYCGPNMAASDMKNKKSIENVDKGLHNHRKLTSNSHPGGAMGIMCSYNSIHKVPACANPTLLQTTLRKDWNFKGYVVSDCGAIANLYYTHHYASSYEEAVGMALRAGVDLDCGNTIQEYGLKALEMGYMEKEDVDRALANLFGVLMDLGHFDPLDDSFEEKTSNANSGGFGKGFKDALAFDAALQSIVLLKNGPGDTQPMSSTYQSQTMPLPLSLSEHKKITLIGPFIDNKETLLGNYYGSPSSVITVKQGLEDHLGIELGYSTTTSFDTSSHYDYKALCYNIAKSNSSATILVMGLDQTIESEDVDKTTLLLPPTQRDTIREAAQAVQIWR